MQPLTPILAPKPPADHVARAQAPGEHAKDPQKGFDAAYRKAQDDADRAAARDGDRAGDAPEDAAAAAPETTHSDTPSDEAEPAVAPDRSDDKAVAEPVGIFAVADAPAPAAARVADPAIPAGATETKVEAAQAIAFAETAPAPEADSPLPTTESSFDRPTAGASSPNRVTEVDGLVAPASAKTVDLPTRRGRTEATGPAVDLTAQLAAATPKPPNGAVAAPPVPVVAARVEPLEAIRPAAAAAASSEGAMPIAADARAPEVTGSDRARVDAPNRTEMPRGVVGQVVEAVRQGRDGRVELSLVPEDLGRVRMSLQPGEAGLHLVLQADRPETQDLLRRHIALLETELAGLGYAEVSVDFSAAGNGGLADDKATGDAAPGGDPSAPSENAGQLREPGPGGWLAGRLDIRL